MNFVLPSKFSNDSERRGQVSTSFYLQLSIAGYTLYIFLKNRALSKNFCFTLIMKQWLFPKLK